MFKILIMEINTKNEYIVYDGELMAVEPNDPDFKIYMGGNFTAILDHEEYNGRDDSFYMKTELEEDTLYLPFIGSNLVGSLFAVKNPEHCFSWNGGITVTGFIFIENIAPHKEHNASACFNVSGSKMWVNEEDLQKYKDKYELEYIGNIFDAEIKAFEDYELQRARVKECYLIRLVETYRDQFQELELERIERIAALNFAEIHGSETRKEEKELPFKK